MNKPPRINNPDEPATRQFIYDLLDRLAFAVGDFQDVNEFRASVQEYQDAERHDPRLATLGPEQKL
jgi:hypothetical protein